MIGCSLMCTYCPQENLRVAYGDDAKYMSLDTFRKVLANTPLDYRIDFSGMAEPWINPECTAMVEHAIEQGYNIAIFTTFYNWTVDDANRIVSLMERYHNQFRHGIVIHYPDRNGNMLGWKYTDEWVQVHDIIRGACARLKITCDSMTMDKDVKIHPDIDDMGIELSAQTFFGHDRAASLDVNKVKEQPIAISPRHQMPVMCAATRDPVVFNHNVVLPNGDVVLCCMDYGLKHVLGNLLQNTLYEIYQMPPLQQLIATNTLMGTTDQSLCKNCQSATPYIL